MTKWADYVITEVRHKDPKERVHILQVKAFQDLGDRLGTLGTYSREQIVDAIERKVTFCTGYKNKEGRFGRGADVHIIVIKGVKFIRTDEDNIEADNLGELPEF